MDTCSRCGQSGHIEYGSDGLAYCNSCIFYGLNKPCWKCRMYLPASELQQYRGQLTCQYCIMDLRDEERRMEDRGKTKERDRGLGEERQEDRCERCGRTLEIAYFYHNKRLCASCTEREKGNWEGKGGDAPAVAYRIRKEKGALSSIVEAVEKKIRDTISDKISGKESEEAWQDKKESKEHKKEEKKPMAEELAKTSGMKYELADYKDIKIDEPKKQEKRKDEPGEKSEKASEKKEKLEDQEEKHDIEKYIEKPDGKKEKIGDKKETPEEKYKKHRKKKDDTRSKRKEKKKDEKN